MGRTGMASSIAVDVFIHDTSALTPLQNFDLLKDIRKAVEWITDSSFTAEWTYELPFGYLLARAAQFQPNSSGDIEHWHLTITRTVEGPLK